MRYILAAVSLVLSLVLLGLGVAQRTIWAPPDTIVAEAQEQVDAPLVLIPGEAMNAHDGRQTVVVRGEGELTAVVGRAHDVQGWIGESPHALAEVADSGALELAPQAGAETAELPALAGNDMWIEEHSGTGEVRFSIDMPVGYAIAVAGEPGGAAPTDVRIEWPFDAKTPLFGPLVTAGLAMLALSLLLFLLALRRHRRRRGPQRRSHRELTRAERRALARDAKDGLPRGTAAVAPGSDRPAIEAPEAREGDAPAAAPEGAAPEGDASDAARPDAAAPEGEAPSDGRRTERRAAAPRRRGLGLIALPAIAVVALTGCGPQYWPSGAPEPSETGEPTPTSLEETLPPVAVTEHQFGRILEDTRAVAAAADEARDAGAAEARFAGPVLDARRTNYEVRSADGELAAVTGVPDGDIELLLPQQTESWPRTVLAVVGWQDASQTQAAMVFQQASPRDDYRVVYQTALASGVQLPPVASPTIGAASLPLDTPLLQRPPQEITGAYADFMLNGDESEFASWFTPDDPLNQSIGRATKDETAQRPEFELTDLSWSASDDEAAPALLVTNEGGALMATSWIETQRTTPREEGVTVTANDAAGVLSGVDQSESGLEISYLVQVLFAVPAADAPEGTQIQVVGYTESLLDAREIG